MKRAGILAVLVYDTELLSIRNQSYELLLGFHLQQNRAPFTSLEGYKDPGLPEQEIYWQTGISIVSEDTKKRSAETEDRIYFTSIIFCVAI